MFRKLLLVAVSSVALPLLCAQTYRGSIGGEVEIGEGNRSRAFTDLAKTFRPFDSTPIDGNGWPAADFDMLFFDIRPVAAWFGTDRIDDPEKYIPDWSGTYKLSFQGQAAIAASSDPVTIANQQYDAASNTTTADVILPPGTATMSLKFTGTQRDAGGATNTGVTNLKLIRPGYPADGSRVFTDEFLASLQPYTHLRFMGVLDTNSADPKWDVGKSISGNQKKWSDRHLPSDATQQSYGNKHGIAWEYVIELANESNKDIWINIPVSADDDYVRQLARLIHDTLKPGIRIYIEHGNEVWNNSFTGNAWNYNAAQAEILAGGSNLNKPNASPDDIGQRRHLRRVAEIGQAFLDVYGHDALGTLIRPVYAGFILRTGQYSDTLDWFKTNIGVPAKYIYGVAQTHYYNDASARVAGKTIDDVLAAFRQDSDLGIQSTKAMQNVATAFGLKQLVYEGGADILRPNVANDAASAQIPALSSSIGACRDARIKDIVTHDVRDNWFSLGGAAYTYFTISGGVSRYGCWGAVEDVVGPKAGSPKLDALLELVGGKLPAPSISSVVNAASYTGPITPGAFATIFGQNLSVSTLDNWGGVVVSGRLPAAVGGESVRVAGQDSVISFAGPGQINFVVPPAVGAGQATVEVFGPGGKATATATVAAYSPSFFANALNGNTQISGVFVNSNPPVYVAPEGAWPGVLSRPAKNGDWVQLYATGQP